MRVHRKLNDQHRYGEEHGLRALANARMHHASRALPIGLRHMLTSVHLCLGQRSPYQLACLVSGLVQISALYTPCIRSHRNVNATNLHTAWISRWPSCDSVPHLQSKIF